MKLSRSMRNVLLLVTVGIGSLYAQGCCRVPRVNQPMPPDKDRAWVEEKRDGSTFVGPFFLRKGESTEKGKLGVKVVDIVPTRCRSSMAEYPDPAKVVLRFYEPFTKNVFCELTLDDKSGNLIDRPDACGGRIDINAVGIVDINTEQNWVVFNLAR